MEERLIKLKGDFTNIINIRTNVKNIFDILQMRINKLKSFYSEFIKSNQTQMFIFGLDSFHFQSKLIDIEYDDMKRLFLAINNRMYCEYFKLYKIIVEYTVSNLDDKKLADTIKVNNFPLYKDLEPFKEYKFETILEIHESILNLLSNLISMMTKKENELAIHNNKKEIGLNIDNFITTFNFNITVMREKIIMFITYIEFFHNMHTKYLKRFSNKIQLMYVHINTDIKFDATMDMQTSKDNKLEDEMVGDLPLEQQEPNNVEPGSTHDDKTSISSLGTNMTGNSSNEKKEDMAESFINRIRNNSFIRTSSTDSNGGVNLTPRFSNQNKSTMQKFKSNVGKVSNMLQLCKSKEKIVDPAYTEDEISNIFLEIDEKCDSIIHKEDAPPSPKPVESYDPVDNNIVSDNSVVKIYELDGGDSSNEVKVDEVTIVDEIQSEIQSEITFEEQAPVKKTRKPRKKKSDNPL